MDNLKHPHTMVYLTPSSTLQNSYSINWNSQQSHILEGIKQLGGGGGDLEHDLFLTDVTLASCDGEYVPAHKLILSLCSTFFKNLFQRNRNLDKGSGSNTTVLILGHVSGRNLRQLMEFIYQGRVEIPQEDVDSFLQAGTMLKIEGLVDSSGDDSQANSSTNFVTPTAGATLNVPVPPTSGQSNRAESSANSSNKKAKLHPPSNHNHLDSQDHSQSSSSTTTGGEVESIQFCQVELDVEVTSEEEGKGIVESSYFAGRVDPLQIFQYSSSSSSLPSAGETPEESSSSRRSSKRKRSASGGASTLILPNNVPVPPGAKQKRHPIWNMYHYDAEVNACMCLVSGCTSTLAGKKTTNLMRHLNYFHPDEFKKLFGEQSS